MSRFASPQHRPATAASRLGAVLAGISLFALAAGPARAADSLPEMAAHRAFYTLTLAETPSNSTAAATGTMSYEVTDACDGWATHQHLIMHVTDRDGQEVETVSDYTTWESKDGRKLTFKSRQLNDQSVTDQVEGSAEVRADGSGGTVDYTVPEAKQMSLPPGTLLPTAHTQAIIAAATMGKKFFAVPLFDGTGSDGAQDTFVNITSWNGPGAAPYPPLAALPSGRVHVAFYPRKPDSQTPEYQVAMRYWVNGVADDLLMDFGDFSMVGKLSEFRLTPSKC